MAKAKAGIRKIDEIVAQDGTKHAIRCELATGVFSVVFADSNGYTVKRVEGKDLEQVRAEAEAWIKEANCVKWEPVILVRGGRNASWQTYRGSEETIDLSYQRFFRATRKDGDVLYKEFAKQPSPSYPNAFNEAEDDEVEGVPGKDCRASWSDESKVIPYTPSHWSSLRMISVMVRNLNERIHGLIEGDKMEALLESIAKKGAPALLLEAPKQKGEKVNA